MSEFWRVAHLAPRFGVSPRTLRRAIARGEIPAFKRGRVWCVPEAALERLSALLALASARSLAEVSAHSPGDGAAQQGGGGGVASRASDTGPVPSSDKKIKPKEGKLLIGEGNE